MLTANSALGISPYFWSKKRSYCDIKEERDNDSYCFLKKSSVIMTLSLGPPSPPLSVMAKVADGLEDSGRYTCTTFL